VESIDRVPIELTVVLGDSTMPMNHLLKMGCGAIIELNTLENEEVQILANNTPIAKGDVVVKDERIAISITGKLGKDKDMPST
jgi:flagellar motor switch protein FliN/FliY